MIPIILSGGSGTRLWPLSRPSYPKQFLSLHSDQTLFQETLLRLKSLNVKAPIVVCNQAHRFIVAENLRTIDIVAEHILLEPAARNTAPAIMASCLYALKDDENAIVLVLPADHIIKDIDALNTSINTAYSLAQKGYLVTFGVKPDAPNTGYGYLETGDQLEGMANATRLKSFKEKPDLERAKTFIENKNFLWNSGMFCFKASVLLEEMKAFQPTLFETVKQSVEKAEKDLDFERLSLKEFEKSEDISIDYAVMEHTEKAAIVSLDAGWSDIGSWDSLWESMPKDQNNNAINGDVLLHDSQNNLIHNSNRLITTLGVNDLIIIDTADALLVAEKSKVLDLKNVLQILKSKNRKEIEDHQTVYRPWGHYTSIGMGERDQVKRISVNPGAKLSLQKHFKRSEHWVVVKGIATVTKGNETFELQENESIYLPVEVLHSLENKQNEPLEIIEVQTGTYLGEDDIVRLDDIYGRK